jgi:hypothetical protein
MTNEQLDKASVATGGLVIVDIYGDGDSIEVMIEQRGD